MCETCGCGDPDVVPVDVHDRILAGNERTAAHNREHFRERGVTAVNLMGSPGAGKTAVLEATARRLTGRQRLGALAGDLATDYDADRLRAAGIAAKSITTGSACHLDAEMVHRGLHEFPWRELDYLFIENVGNLVCPAVYDLGQAVNVVALSVTEGEDKPLKYPTIFNTADVCVITKMDLAAAVEFDLDSARENIHAVRPGMRIMELSVKSGQGLEDYMAFLDSKLVVQKNHMDLQLNIENPVNLVRRLSSQDTKVL